MKISSKITLYFIMIAFLCLILFSIFSYIHVSKYCIKKASEEISTVTSTIIKSTTTDTNFEKLDNLKNNHTIRITNRIVDGIIIFTDKNNKILFSNNENFKVNRVLRSNLMSFNKNDKIRSIDIDGVTYLGVIRRFNKEINNKKISKLIYLADISEVRDISKEITFAQLKSTIFVLLIIIFLSFLISKNISKPIYLLKNHAEKITPNQIIEPIEIKTNDELESLGTSINNLADRLNKHEESQKRFLQNISHELKSPLMSIQGYAEGIKDGIIVEEELEDSLDIIINESQRLKKLVDEIIYLSKLENNDSNYKFESLNMKELINSSIDKIKGMTIKDNINILCNNNIDYIRKVDKEKIYRALINVLSNAIKYSKSQVIIKTELIDKRLVIRITDDGNGFTDKDLTHIFERFYKGNNGSTGLGLVISKTIIQGHGGEIIAYNSSDLGATIEIKL